MFNTRLQQFNAVLLFQSDYYFSVINNDISNSFETKHFFNVAL